MALLLIKFRKYNNNDIHNARHLSSAAEDDAVLVKNMGQSFRFTAVAVLKPLIRFYLLLLLYFQNFKVCALLCFLKARKEDEMKSLHDEAIFGVSSQPPPAETDEEAEASNHGEENVKAAPTTSLLSNQVVRCTLELPERKIRRNPCIYTDETLISAGFK